jgi:hypothetical protein
MLAVSGRGQASVTGWRAQILRILLRRRFCANTQRITTVCKRSGAALNRRGLVVQRDDVAELQAGRVEHVQGDATRVVDRGCGEERKILVLGCLLANNGPSSSRTKSFVSVAENSMLSTDPRFPGAHFRQ